MILFLGRRLIDKGDVFCINWPPENAEILDHKEQRAFHSISVEPKILLEIEDFETEIATLQAELQATAEKQDFTPENEEENSLKRKS